MSIWIALCLASCNKRSMHMANGEWGGTLQLQSRVLWLFWNGRFRSQAATATAAPVTVRAYLDNLTILLNFTSILYCMPAPNWIEVNALSRIVIKTESRKLFRPFESKCDKTFLPHRECEIERMAFSTIFDKTVLQFMQWSSSLFEIIFYFFPLNHQCMHCLHPKRDLLLWSKQIF